MCICASLPKANDWRALTGSSVSGVKCCAPRGNLVVRSVVRGATVAVRAVSPPVRDDGFIRCSAPCDRSVWNITSIVPQMIQPGRVASEIINDGRC
jgi:hypothetical protein